MYYGKEIPVYMLKENSNKKVEVICPSCGEKRVTFYKSYIMSESDMCQPCTVRNKTRIFLPLGKTFNKLTVLKPSKASGSSLCRCECGSTVDVDNWALKTGHTKSCGCLKKESFNETKKVEGEEHGMWKGGVSSERDRMMQTVEYKSWRKSVFKRDSYTCQKCLVKGGTLNAHHIIPFSENIDLRTSVDNGITLCEECHRDFHSTYGVKSTGINEIHKFLN